MKVLRISLLMIMMLALAINLAWGAQEDKDKGKGNDKGQSISHPVHPQNRGQALKELRRSLINNQLTTGVELPEPKIYGRVPERLTEKENEKTLRGVEQALKKLEHARWAYNPNDDRGQGNMGKVNMLDPYGHDKDSNRKELYGNRGRVIRVTEPEPPPTPEPEPPPTPEPEPPQEPEPEPPQEPEPPPVEPVPQPPF